MNQRILYEFILDEYTFDDILKETHVHKNVLLSSLLRLQENNMITFKDKLFIQDMMLQNFYYNTYNKSSKFIIISDLHAGSKNEKIHFWNITYDYAVVNNIKDIYIAGDLVDGIFTHNKTHLDTYEKQFNHFISEYPKESNINNYALLGNHDYLFFKEGHIDMCTNLEEKRDDFTVIGYKRSYIKILSNIICFKHSIDRLPFDVPTYNPCLSFKGHSHYYSYRAKKKNKIDSFRVPHLSEYIGGQNVCEYSYPGFLVVEFFSENNLNYYTVSLNYFNNRNVILKDEKNLVLQKKYP